jgi:thiol-disulfide isomerase/thioredoxin
MRLPHFPAILSALRDPKRWRRWGLEALIFIAIISAVSLWQNRGLPEGEAPPLAGMRNDGVVTSLNGKVGVASAGHFRPDGLPAGGTASSTAATLVVFWATWCPVCKAEEGNIVAVAKDWPVLSVALQSGDAAAISKHLKVREIDLPAVVDEDGAIAADWNVQGVPAHFIIDPAGKIRFRVVGYATTLGLRARLWWAENFPA